MYELSLQIKMSDPFRQVSHRRMLPFPGSHPSKREHGSPPGTPSLSQFSSDSVMCKLIYWLCRQPVIC